MPHKVLWCFFSFLLIHGPTDVAAQGSDAGPPEQSRPRLIGPRQGAARTQALRRNGGSTATEKAVEAGLDWLARHQEAHGGWDADGFDSRCKKDGMPCTGVGKGQHGEQVPCPFDHAISGLATLAFLGHGHVSGRDGDPYAAVVEKALQRLGGGGDRWGFVIATQAFAEAEAMEGKGRWRDTVMRRARRLLLSRVEDGAWGYAPGYGRGSDVPYSAFVVQALVAARDVGFELPRSLAVQVDRFLTELEVKRGRLAYLRTGRRFGYTPTSENGACAAAMRALLDVGTKGKRHRMHMALLARQRPKWKISFKEINVPGKGIMKVQIGKLSMYRWWYGTIAAFHAGGSAWSGWNGRLKGALLGKQCKKGCARGSWDPKGLYERQTGGRVFATALGILMLEQPYRQRRT